MNSICKGLLLFFFVTATCGGCSYSAGQRQVIEDKDAKKEDSKKKDLVAEKDTDKEKGTGQVTEEDTAKEE